MIKGLYTSALSLSVLERRQEANTNNLANINTPGYKKDVVVSGSFPDMLLYRLNDRDARGKTPKVGNISMGVQVAEIYTDHTKGIMRQSENPSALAVSGEGYFTVNTPQGERYTKNGDFSIDVNGRLVSTNGYPLLGQKGDIVVKDAAFQVDKEGRVYSAGEKVDSLKIVQFTTPLIKEGASLFKGNNPVDVLKPYITQGMVEESNVNAVTEMVNMIDVMRAYESSEKVIQTIDGTLDKAVNDVGRV
ncbi:MAG: flagellar hook-basal body protein [Clostridia bacterium]|nr:flagellar hook-basal body protein [Clostridia bacterium]MDD4047892.1 flagellar hook-basal body protein [Clostridia bacterium]